MYWSGDFTEDSVHLVIVRHVILHCTEPLIIQNDVNSVEKGHKHQYHHHHHHFDENLG